MPAAAARLPPDLDVLRFSVAQYHAMRDAGILGEEDRVELLGGLLVSKMTKSPRHRLATGLIRAALEQARVPDHYVDSQEPITTEDSEPEPDVVVVRGVRRDYADRHPGPGDLALVVEVADESLARDRGLKSAIYARAGIPVYWIVNLRARSVEVLTDPRDDGYAQRSEHPAGSELPLVVGGREIARIAVESILP